MKRTILQKIAKAVAISIYIFYALVIVFVLSLGNWAWEHPVAIFIMLALLVANVWGMNKIYPIEKAFSAFVEEEDE